MNPSAMRPSASFGLETALVFAPTPQRSTLLAGGAGHQQHIKLLRSLLERLSVAMLIEQGQDSMITAGRTARRLGLAETARWT
jgi:hypothetical protein